MSTQASPQKTPLSRKTDKFGVNKPFKCIKLRDKVTGNSFEFRVYLEKDLTFLKCRNEKKKLILDFNMKELELEYDYATDAD